MVKRHVPALLSLLSAALAFSASATSAAEKEQALINWVEANGGMVGFYVGKECDTCLRGALASQAYRKGDIVARIPLRLGITFPYRGEQKLPGEFAVEWLTAMHTDPAFNSTWGPYWDSLPLPEEVLCQELFSEAELQLAQSNWLTGHARTMQQSAHGFYQGQGSQMSHPFDVPLEMFMYVSALVATRSFTADMGGMKKTLMPVFDMINHHAVGNVVWDLKGGDLVFRARASIRRGEQLYHNYNHQTAHRLDLCFSTYGFIPPNSPPLLFAQDLPNFNPTNPFKGTARTDAKYVKNSGSAMRKEVQRLQSILDSLPTTLQEDLPLLQAAEGRDRLFLQLRVERKKALQHRIKILRRELLIERLFISCGGGALVLLAYWAYRRSQRRQRGNGTAGGRPAARARDSRKRR